MDPELCPSSLVVVTKDDFGEFQQIEFGDIGRFLKWDGPYADIDFFGVRKIVHPSFLICMAQHHWPKHPFGKIISLLGSIDKVENGDTLKLHEQGIRSQLEILQNYINKFGYHKAETEIDSANELLGIYPAKRSDYPALPRHLRKHFGRTFLYLLRPERTIKIIAVNQSHHRTKSKKEFSVY